MKFVMVRLKDGGDPVWVNFDLVEEVHLIRAGGARIFMNSWADEATPTSVRESPQEIMDLIAKAPG